MADNLKPCPVPECHGALILNKHHFQRSLMFRVSCLRCGAQGPERKGRSGRAEAIAAWNNRSNDAVIEAAQRLVEAMETCHQCSEVLLVEDGPMYCSEGGCSSDCEDHEEPGCVPISELHAKLKRALAALLPAKPEEPCQTKK